MRYQVLTARVTTQVRTEDLENDELISKVSYRK